ncbi:zinc finger FYVE domain-containing protein 26-like, partial [Physella acuta]|uniref:zinc finger FYVE domain-containing protein 26-like n=1 Tax=Physella acuta TaxID=109671 RepID=UPI0027DD10C4
SANSFTIDWIKFDDTFSICLNFTKLTEGVSGASQGVSGASQGVSGASQGVSGASQGVSGASQGVSGASQGVSGASQGVSGASQGVSGASQGVSGASQGVSGASQGVSGASQGVSGASQGVSGASQGVSGASQGVSGASQGVSSQQEPEYNLSPITLEYVKQNSLLLATLVSLVCSDQLDNIEQHLTDDHFSSSDLLRPHRSSSDMSLVDMRSYRYHRLTSDYPLLQRHLLHCILPLAACDNPQLVDSSEPILKFVTNDINDQVKLCMFSLPDSLQFVRVIQATANRLVLEHKWQELFTILSCLPRSLVQGHRQLQTLHDYVLASWAVSQLLQPVPAADVGDQLRQFSHPSCQARTVLSLIDQLPLDQSLDLLELLLTCVPAGGHMWHTVAGRLQQLAILNKIERTLKKLEPAVVCRFSKWQEIERASKNQPHDILHLLEQAADFDTALAWARLFAADLVHIVQERHLKCVLTCEPSDTVTAFQLLDDLLTHSPTQCLAVCQTVLTSLTKPKEIKFVVSFILSYLSQLLPTSEDLRLQQIGAKALMAIPPRIVPDYMHLISCPHLILEQLLMNMKAELAGQIFDQIKCELLQVKDEVKRVRQEDFNLMLATYARLALQVKVVQVNEKCDSESGQSGNSAGGTRRNSVLERNEMCASPTASLHQECNKSLSNQFIVPPNPPHPDQWMADSSTSVCMACKVERFSMFNRRHHCRRCGRVVCGTCSTRLTLVFDVMSRTCDQCVEQTNLVSEECEVYSQMTDPPPNQLSPAVNQLQLCWKLEPDPVYCQLVRKDFYFEQAPSVTLCVSILKQHSSRLEAGMTIIEMCDQLSQLMVPVSPGVPNPEIDYNLIISVMKQLLFHAKLDFNYNIGQCDMYLARLDLLKTMVEANYQDLPTLRELTKQDTVRRLRDKLLADERLALAMDVSTKCGIDPTGVWSAMGFACLSLGDFQGAREKFGHCLKVLTDRNKSSPSQSRLLTEILELVDTLPSDGITEVQRLVSNPGSICHTHTLLVPGKGDENRAESVPYKECLYYLRTYGSYLDQISFLRQHNYWMKAAQLAADHHCSPEVFLTGLLMPAMCSGQLGRLLEQMLMLDPSLDKWSPYLTATCKYLLKEKYFSTLYHVQLFMKDYIRAAMTCISHFYQRDARSYLDLSERLQFLLVAQQHLQAYLDPGQWGSVPHPLTPVTPPASKRDKAPPEAARMTLTPEQVN